MLQTSICVAHENTIKPSIKCARFSLHSDCLFSTCLSSKISEFVWKDFWKSQKMFFTKFMGIKLFTFNLPEFKYDRSNARKLIWKED